MALPDSLYPDEHNLLSSLEGSSQVSNSATHPVEGCAAKCNGFASVCKTQVYLELESLISFAP